MRSLLLTILSAFTCRMVVAALFENGSLERKLMQVIMLKSGVALILSKSSTGPDVVPNAP
jgi:hypothetical protein